MDALMSMIDDVKTKLTDEEYKQLCDKMMALNKKHEGYYRVWYVITDTQLIENEYDDDDGKIACETQYYHKFDNVVVKLSSETVVDMRDTIQRNGHCCSHHELLNLSPQYCLQHVTPDKGLVGSLRPLNHKEISVFRIDDLE